MPRLEFRTARSALQSKGDEANARFDQFLEELGPNAVVVVAEGGTEADRRAFIDALTAQLANAKDVVGEVFYRIPLDFFERRALGLAPAPALETLAASLEKESEAVATLSRAGGLSDIHKLIGERVQKDMASGRRAGAEDSSGLRVMLDLAAAQKKLLEDPPAAAAAVEKLDLLSLMRKAQSDAPGISQLAHDGYVASADGSLYLAMVRPAVRSDSQQFLQSFLGTIRAAAEEARRPRHDVHYGLTGVPVTVVEESESVKRDAPSCLGIAALGIGLLVGLAFRRKLNVLLILLSLAMGILWSFGLTWAIFGGINLITSAVPVILLALGIDFGIHVVVAYEAERVRGLAPRDSIAEALARLGPGLTTGAVTTALAFFAICFMEYRGFREFGVVAGCGVLVCLLAMVTALPALLIATDRRPSTLGPSPLERLRPPDAPAGEALPGGEAPALEVLPRTSRARRWWRTACRAATAFPLTSTLAAAGLTAYFLVLARQIGFDYRVEDLLPRNAESIVTQEKLKRDPALSPHFAAAFYADRASLAAADARAAGEKLIARRQSILNLLPDESPDARRALMQKVLSLLRAATLDPGRIQPVDPAALKKSLEELAAVFQRALDMAASTKGLEETVRLLDQISTTLEDSAELVGAAQPGWPATLEAGLKKIWAWAAGMKAKVEEQLAAGPVVEADLPPEISNKLKGRHSGNYVLYFYPAEDMEDREAVARFVAVMERIEPTATGYPIVFYHSTSLIHRGFSTAVIAAAVVIFLTLLLDFRKPSRVLLATLPKVLGIIWMLGIMRLLGLNYNLANQIVIPLLIGVGLAYGIHIIHRFFMEKDSERNITTVLEQTGGAIALSGLTTMIGFGSLALADHRGLASMGTVLFCGVGAALVASTYVLANILVLIYRPRR